MMLRKLGKFEALVLRGFLDHPNTPLELSHVVDMYLKAISHNKSELTWGEVHALYDFVKQILESLIDVGLITMKDQGGRRYWADPITWNDHILDIMAIVSK